MGEIVNQAGANTLHPRGLRPKTAIWALANEDFSDLTVAQISEVLDIDTTTVAKYIVKLKKDYGINVNYKKASPGRKRKLW